MKQPIFSSTLPLTSNGGWSRCIQFLFIPILLLGTACKAQKKIAASNEYSQVKAQPLKQPASFKPGALWYDDKGELINAHGGGLLYRNKTWYWFGESRGERNSKGVNVYSSKDLYQWKNEGLALAQEKDDSSDIAIGGLMERPKVIYNTKTKKYIMWFHLELKGKGYSAARAAVATSDRVTGPYKYLHSFRPNGNMSRDMGLFVDDDNTAYQVYSSRENYDMHIVRLTDDWLAPTTQDSMIFSNHREAPALFRYQHKYYLITSGCTGWAPNTASLHVANALMGPWVLAGDPMKGPGAALTFASQSTFVLQVQGKKGAFIFIADKWNPKDLKDSRYIWLPVQFKNKLPFIEWEDEWDLKFFD